MKRFTRLSLALLAFGLLCQPAAAGSIEKCSERTTDSKSVAVTCLLRTAKGDDLKALKVTAGNQPLTAISYADQAFDVDQFIMIDTSKSLSRTEFELQKKVAQAIVGMKVEKRQIALSTFSSGYQEIAPLGSDANLVNLALPNVKGEGQTTELLAALDKAINSLGKSQALHKTIFILSDGAEEDTGFSVKELIDKAKAQNVSIVTILPRGDAVSFTKAQGARRLADETGGFIFVADSEKKLADLEKEVTALYARLASVNFVAEAAKTEITLTNADGSTSKTQFESKLFVAGGEGVTPAKPVPEAPKTLLEKARKAFADAWSWVLASYVHQAIAGLGTITFLALVVWLAASLRGRRKQDGSVMDLPPPLAFVQYFDGRSTREGIYNSSTRIGRASDNDIVLNHDTVHRYHAVLTCLEPGRFEITDLQTANGVKVNGNRVTRQRLNNGDVMEFGEVRLRFLAV